MGPTLATRSSETELTPPPTLFSKRKHPKKRKLRQREPASGLEQRRGQLALYRRPRPQGRPSTNSSHPPSGGTAADPRPPQPQGHLDGALTGAPGSGLRTQHSVGCRGRGSSHGWGSQGVSFLGWSHHSTAYLRRPGLALGERPLSHGRNVLTLRALLSADSAAPGRPPQPARSQAQLPGPAARPRCRLLPPAPRPGLASISWAPGWGVCSLEQKAVAAETTAHTPPDSSLCPEAAHVCSWGRRPRAAGQRHTSTHSLCL